MDEQTRALFQQLLGELYRRMEKDPEIRRALKRIEDGKATFRDTALWSDRSAELLGTVFSEAIGDMPTEARESLCKALLRERYDSTFDLCREVQEALDERLGISLKPVKPKFPAERVQQIAHSLLDPTVAAAVIERRARAPVATAARSFHDDYIRENASVRTDLGFKCYLHRIAATGCCPWCTDIAGRYVYGSHPDDIFRRHDNCACTVTFENGRERQDVWSKRTWDARDPEEIERLAQEPVVNSQEQAREIEENGLRGLTFAGERDIIDLEDIIIGRSVGSRARNYDIMDLETGEHFSLAEGTSLRNVQVFAGKGVKKPYERAWKYADKFGGNADDWQHVKGIGTVDYYGEYRDAELHWSQCDGYGKHDFFIKRWLE